MSKYRFVPEENITAYEVAYIFARLSGPINKLGVSITDEQFADMPKSVSRHFVVWLDSIEVFQ